MSTRTDNDSREEVYFADRAEHLIGQAVGTLDASAGHPADPEGGWPARVAALEDRLADVERRLAELERPWPDASARGSSPR